MTLVLRKRCWVKHSWPLHANAWTSLKHEPLEKKRKHLTRRADCFWVQKLQKCEQNEDLIFFFFLQVYFLPSGWPVWSPAPPLHQTSTFQPKGNTEGPSARPGPPAGTDGRSAELTRAFCPTLICIRCPHQAVEQLVSVGRHRRLQCFQEEPKTQTSKMIIQWRLTRNPVQEQNVIHNMTVHFL